MFSELSFYVVGSVGSIILAIFAGKREDSIQKSKNRFRIGHDSFARIGKNPLKTLSFGVGSIKKVLK
jgi:hypothetical protein